MIARNQVCAGIVSYNPDITRIAQNISSVLPQVDRLYLVDNGSSNYSELSELVRSRFAGIIEIANESNLGIAAALNQLASSASKDGYKWIVTLDQDSVCTKNMVSVLMRYASEDVGIVAPQIIDRNKEEVEIADSLLDHKTFDVVQAARKGILTSGSLTSLSAWAFVGGFDEDFFIDYVDYDFNKRLLLEGYRLVRTGDTALIHECGKACPTPLFTPRKGQDGVWRLERFYSFGHSPFRCYYKARNRILYSRKYKRCDHSFQFEGTIQIIPQMILTLLFESDRKNKFKSFIRGIQDGRNAKVIEYVPKGGPRN